VRCLEPVREAADKAKEEPGLNREPEPRMVGEFHYDPPAVPGPHMAPAPFVPEVYGL
jgi:hypothetical protein